MDLQDLIEAAIREDIPAGDITTESLDKKSHPGEAHLIAKEDLILSGKEPFEMTVKNIAPDAKIKWNFSDGDLVLNRQIVAVIEGNLIQLLKAERISLNFIGRLSGVATLTSCFVKRIEQTNTQILDTRKTVPGYRALDKKAVRDGGGKNHRMDLSDAIMIKENHIQVAGSLKNAVEQIRRKTHAPIEVEVKNIDEVKEALDIGVNRLLLDNMTNEQISEALEIIPSAIETEASGNMNMERILSVAELGVNYISVGALTHSAPCADFSLLFIWDDE